MKIKRVFLHLFFSIFICTSFSIPCTAGKAEARPKAKGAAPTFSLGAGAVFSTTPYQGADNEIMAIPLLMLSGEQFFIRGTGAGVHVYQNEQLSVDLLGKYKFDAYKAGDSASLVGIKDRNGTVEAGVTVNWRFEQAVLSCKGFTDLLNEHGGQEINFRIRKPVRWRMLFFDPYLGISLLSDNFSTYYYGVDSTEAIAGRSEYDLGRTVNWQAGLALRVGLTRNIMFNTLFGLEILDHEITDSPIVDLDALFFGMAGIAFGF